MAIQIHILISVLCLIILVVRCDESILQIVLKRPISVVSDEFVSFAVDPAEVMGLPDRTMYVNYLC